MRRRDLLTSAAVALACATAPRRLRAQTDDLQKLRLVAVPTDALTPLYYGIKQGAFQRAGIDLEILPAASGAAAVTAMLGGAYDIANASLLAVLSAHLHDIPVLIVGPQLLYTPENPFALLQIAVDSPIKTGADLDGKIVAVSALNDLNQLAISSWVDKNGGSSKTLKFVEMPAVATDEALFQHRVDAGLLPEPILDNSLSAGRTKTLGDAFGAVAKAFISSAYIARTDWASSHSDVLLRFNRVAAQMSAYTNAHQAETAPMMAEATKIPLAVMLRMKRAVIATTLDDRLVQPLIDAAAKYQMISHAFPAKEIIWSPRSQG
jgi:NitT/TauT family transport system substrate-binding protein